MSQRQEELSERLWESHHKHVHEEHMDALRKTDADLKNAQQNLVELEAKGMDTSVIKVKIAELTEKQKAQEESAWEYFDKFKK